MRTPNPNRETIHKDGAPRKTNDPKKSRGILRFAVVLLFDPDQKISDSMG
jgi:hypothetical protein